MHRFCLLLFGMILASAASAAPDPVPRRILSQNLCADQYLLELADRSQIVALTRLVHDTGMSAGAARARDMPTSGGSAEEILALAPDLIVTTPGRAATLPRRPDGRAYRVLELPPADSYAAIIAQVRLVATAVGQRARGEALIMHMDATLASLGKPPATGRTAAYYQRRGYMTGTGTLVDDLIRRVGLINLAARLGKPMLARLSLEEMGLARPGYLIVETATDQVNDRGSEMLHHPILKDIPRLRLPEAWTVCGGPAYVSAARSLLRQMRETRRTAPRPVRP